jgi:AcrR family transcriptional regulator
MSPRAYNLGLRLAAAEQTRGRIINAAREILSDDEFDGLSIDAISRRAGVARMTVYYQFTSRRGLIEALYDDLAARGLLANLPAVQEETDPKAAMFRLVEVFTRFWANDRLILRRLHGLAVIDTEIEAGMRLRDQMRTEHVRGILHRIAVDYGWSAELSVDEATSFIATLINFDQYDQLAPPESSPETTIDLLQRSIRSLLRL